MDYETTTQFQVRGRKVRKLVQLSSAIEFNDASGNEWKTSEMMQLKWATHTKLTLSYLYTVHMK